MRYVWLLACMFLISINFLYCPFQEKALALEQPIFNMKNKSERALIMKGPSTKREIALTFDDAPDDIFTPKILDILKEKKVKATFFLVGHRIEKYPDIAKRIVQEGHAVGNHSYNHPNFLQMKEADFKRQINRTDKLISSLTGSVPTIVRPPYGEINDKQIEWLTKYKRVVVEWDVDSLDWKGLKSEEIVNNILSGVNPGSIVLLHSGTGEGGDLSGTVEALSTVIDDLRKKGFKMVTIPDLLDIP
ncbi:polysaccharide deacetylase family protein [Siminovitchia terrae]|uniref:polysaccharide deacetylase family protein n=1 Tax=Siminovitchia terrae TaxID=1914933 RepID=UPI001B22B429|nr:polysaccharide deacetylase family protein [Siminovitchia terrae]GIN92513.1 hypothetical protein J22TS1_35640 [Siminovitchia terrae]